MALNLSLRQGIYLLNRDTAVIIWGASFRGGVGLVHIPNYAKCLNRSKKKHFYTKKCWYHQDKTSFVVWETTAYAAFSSLYIRFLSAARPINGFFVNLCCGSSPFVFPTEEILRKKTVSVFKWQKLYVFGAKKELKPFCTSVVPSLEQRSAVLWVPTSKTQRL